MLCIHKVHTAKFTVLKCVCLFKDDIHTQNIILLFIEKIKEDMSKSILATYICSEYKAMKDIIYLYLIICEKSKTYVLFI